MPWLDDQCRGKTQKGKPCKNKATANGYCYLHGGYTRDEEKEIHHFAGLEYPDEVKQFQDEQNQKWQEKNGSGGIVLLLVIVSIMLLLAIVTGDFTWFTR